MLLHIELGFATIMLNFSNTSAYCIRGWSHALVRVDVSPQDFAFLAQCSKLNP